MESTQSLERSKNDSSSQALPSQRRFGMLRGLFVFPSLTFRRVSLVMALALGAVVMQAASIGLLLPAAQVVDDPDSPTPGGFLGEAIDSAISAVGLSQSIAVLFVAVIVMVVVAQLFLYAHDFFSVKVVQDLIADLRRAAFRGFLYARMPFHYTYRSGTLMTTMFHDGERAQAALYAMRDVMIRSIMVGLYAVVLLLISWQMALITFGILLALTAITQLWLKGSKLGGEEIWSLNEEIVSFGTERLQAVREVKLAASEDRDSLRLDVKVNALALATGKMIYRGSQIRFVSEIAVVGTGLLVIYLGLRVIDLSLAEMAVFIYALIRVTPEVRAVNQGRYRIAGHGNSLRNLLDIIEVTKREAEDGVDGAQVTAAGKPLFSGLSKEMVFDGVTFAYDSGPRVLSDISFSIAAGRTTAIVGASGEGKSTILALLVRLLSPDTGSITIDGTPIEEFDLRSIRSGIAMVSQDSAILDDSILENIRYSRPTATLEEVQAAAQMANAHQFIQELPRGYETVAGARGVSLSVGQCQRLALARALLPNPSVLLLDEITSAQDPESESLLQEALWRASSDRTVVIVSHRLSSVQGVDRVLVLEAGKFVEDGPPEQLLGKNGLFRRYYELQIGSGWEQARTGPT